MGFGVKVKITPEINAKNLRSQIQNAIEEATQGKPVKIRHLSIDIGRQEASRISNQLESAIASQDLTIKIGKIDASKPVNDLKEQLTTMLSGLSITGLKDFIGADGVENSYGKALQTLKVVQSTLFSTLKTIMGVEDSGAVDRYTEQYNALHAAIRNVKNMSEEAQSTEVSRIVAETSALKKEVAVQIESEKAAKRKSKAAKSAEEVAADAARKGESAARKEYNTITQGIQLRERINQWASNNTRAYQANKIAVDALIASLQDASKLTNVNIAQIRQQFEGIKASAQLNGTTGKSFGALLSEGWVKFGGWSIVTRSLMQVYDTIKKMIGAVTELDSAMTELKKVTDFPQQVYDDFVWKAGAMAKEIGATLSDTVTAVADFSRLGYNLQDASALATAALVYKNVGDGIENISVATESLISTMKAFGIEASEAMSIVDKFNQVGNNFAISSSGIGDALQRSAAALAAGGNTLEESIGLITAMNNVIQNPDSVGTTLKTVSMYLRAAKTEAEAAGESTDGMADSVSQLRQELLDLTGQKVDIMIDDKTFKSTFQIMRELSKLWGDLSGVTQANITNLLGGKRNANAVSALLTNFEDAEKAAESALHAVGSATAENEKYLDSIAGKVAIFKANFEALSNSVVNSSLIKFVLDLSSGIMSVATWLQKVHVLLPTIHALALVIQGGRNGYRATNAANDIIAAISQGMGKEDILSTAVSATEKLTLAQKKLVMSQLDVGKHSSTVSKELRGQISEAIGLSVAYQRSSTAGGKFVGTVKGIGSALKAAMRSWQAWILGIEAVYAIISWAVDGYNRSIQESIEKADNAIKSYADSQSSYKNNIYTLSSLKDEFDSLSAGVDENGRRVSLTAEQYKRYLSIIDQIIDISPGIVKGYDREGMAILNYRDALQDAITQQEIYMSNQKAIYLQSGQDIFSGGEKQYKKYQIQLGSAGWDLEGVLGARDMLPNTARSTAYHEALESIGLPFWMDFQENYSGLVTLYERKDDFLRYLAESGQFTEEKLRDVTAAIYGLSGAYTGLQSVKNQEADYLSTWVSGQAWYKDIPIDALYAFHEGLVNVLDPLKSYRDNVQLVGLYGDEFAKSVNSNSVKGLIDLASGLTDGVNDGKDEIAAYNAAVAEFISTCDSASPVTAALASFLYSLTNSAVSAADGTDGLSTSTAGLAKSLDGLTKGYKLLDQATSEMEKNGGLSTDTVASILASLGESENPADYLSVENGQIMLNIEKWKERSAQIINSDISNLEREIAGLEAQNDVLDENSDDYAYNAKQIASLNQQLELYKAIRESILSGDDPTKLDTLWTGLDSVSGGAKDILSAMSTLRGGVALTYQELVQLASKHQELFQNADLFNTTTVEGQMALMQTALASCEGEYDSLIDAQIESLQAARSQAEANGENVAIFDILIANLTTLKELSLDDLYGADQAKKAAEAYSDLENAIGTVLDVQKLLTSANAPDSNAADLFKSAIDIAQASDGALKLTDMIQSFDAVTGAIVWNEEAIRSWADSVVDSIPDIQALEAQFPGITQWLKEMAQATAEAKNGTEQLVSAFDGISKASSFMSKLGAADADPFDMIESAIGLAQSVDGFKWTDLFSGIGDNSQIQWNIDKIYELTDALVNAKLAGIDAAELPPGFAAWMKEQARGAVETAFAYDSLSTAISAVKKSSDLLTDIESGEGDVLDMLQSVSEMAQQSGQDINDFFSITDGRFVWDKNAVTLWAENLVDNLSSVSNISPEVQKALKDMIVSQAEATALSEQMAESYQKVKSALEGAADINGRDEISYEAYQELIELDARYADAVTRTNGVLTINREKYNEVTNAILVSSRAEAEAALQAALLDSRYIDLTSRMDDLSDAERKELDGLNAQIMGYSVLIGELGNASSAYQRFLRASTVSSTERYSATEQAKQVIEDTLKNKDSDIYGKVGREQYKLAVEMLIDPQIDPNSKEFDKAMKTVNRYVTDGSKGVQNFYKDLVKGGFIDETTGMLTASLDLVCKKLGITQDLARAMFDELETYQDSPFQWLDNKEMGVIERNAQRLERYMQAGAAGVQNFYDDLKNNNLIDAATNQILAPIEQIADTLGISTEAVRTMFSNMDKYVDFSSFEDAQDAAESAGGAAEDASGSMEEVLAQAKELLTTAGELNPAMISFDTESAVSGLGVVSQKLSELLTKLYQLSRTHVTASATVRYTNQYSSGSTAGASSGILGGLWGGLFGKSSASGTHSAKGGRTLVGELGPETVVDPSTNTWYTVGNKGAEFVRLPEGAIVFNARQTQELFGKGRTESQGDAMAAGNALMYTVRDAGGSASKSESSGLFGKLKDGIVTGIKDVTTKVVSSVKTGVSNTLGALAGALAGIGADVVGSVKPPSSNGGGGGSGGGGGGGSAEDELSALEALQEQYSELNDYLEHLIAHQQFLFKQAQHGLDFPGMQKSLEEQARLYKEIMANAQKAVQEMIAAGATDNDKELQEMEEVYWAAYDNLYGILDEINALYVDAINEKIDGIQTAYSNLAQAAKEFNDYGGITVDSFQALIANGVQYMSLLENVNGQYVINKDTIQKLIAAQKEQLAIEQALSYLRQLSTALTNNDSNAVAHLVDMTESLSTSTWSAVYAQAAMLQNSGLTAEQYNQVIANLDALRSITNEVLTDITADLDGVNAEASKIHDEQKDALEDILDLTEDLIKHEAKEQVQAIKDEIEAYKKIIALKKESLQTSKDEADYTKQISEKTAAIAEMQAKIDQLSLDNSREAQAQRAALEKELRDLQDELNEFQTDHAYDAQVDELDKMAEAYEESRQDEIDQIENSISSAEKLHQAAMDRLNTQWESIYDNLIAWNTEAGNSLNSEITESWLTAAEAVKLYGSYAEAVAHMKLPSTGNAGAPSGGLSNVVADALPKFHSGGTVGKSKSLKDDEVLSILQEGETVLDKPAKRSLYEIIDFQKMLSEKLGTFISNIKAPLMNLTPSVAGFGAVRGGVGESRSMTFNPIIRVEISHNGAMNDGDAKRYGAEIANTTIGKLYEAFEMRGVTSIFGGKTRQ